jgi:hypothetical protein
MQLSVQILKSLLSLILLFTAAASFADPPKIWIENSGAFTRDVVTDGTTRESEGFFGAFDVRELVKSNPEALQAVDKFDEDNLYAHLSYWLGVIPSCVVLGVGLGRDNSALTWTGFGTILATFFVTNYFISESRQHMYEAINRFNGVITPTKDGATLGLNVRF